LHLQIHAPDRDARMADDPAAAADVELRAWLAGDASAFEALYDIVVPGLYRFVYRFVLDAQRAEDVVQDVFVKLIDAAPDFSSRQRVVPWVYRVARNRCVDLSRRLKYRRATSLDTGATAGGDDESAGIDPVDRNGAPPESVPARNETCDAVHAALGRLSPEQREIVLLKEFSGLKFREIADLLGIPESTAKSRLFTALRKLRDDLALRRVEGMEDRAAGGSNRS
jgi:RNA polymerase sigma-70 factor (ECF subfamily)